MTLEVTLEVMLEVTLALPASASPRLLAPSLDVARHPILSHEAQSWLIRNDTFPSPGPGRSTIGQVDNGTCMDAPTRLAASARISAGVCAHAKPNRDYHQPTVHATSRVCVCPTCRPADLPTHLACLAGRHGMLAAGCFTMFWSTCRCARARLLTGFVLPARPPAFGRT